MRVRHVALRAVNVVGCCSEERACELAGEAIRQCLEEIEETIGEFRLEDHDKMHMPAMGGFTLVVSAIGSAPAPEKKGKQCSPTTN